MSNQCKAVLKIGSIAAFIVAMTSACSGSNKETDDPSQSSYSEIPITTDTTSEPESPTELPLASLKSQYPDHYYDERRGETYYYIAAVSEEDQKKGRATGDVVAYQYLGTNGSGEHILANLRTNGTVSHRARCQKPCRIIDTDSGEKIAYSSSSVIGVAFQDAFRGKLRIAEWAKVEAARSRPEPVQNAAQPTIFSDEPEETPPLDFEAPPFETPSNIEPETSTRDVSPTESNEIDETDIMPAIE